MEPLLLINLLAHIVQNISGTFANGLLIFLVLRKTPKYLRTYSILILNFAICDFFACVAAFFAQVRILSSGPGLYLIFYGPCCKLFRTWICFVGYSFMLHCYSHGLWSLLVSFSYRYYILGHFQPKRITVIMIVLAIYSPSFLQLALHLLYTELLYECAFWFGSFHSTAVSLAKDLETGIKAIINKRFGYNVTSECVCGHVNIFTWNILPFILHMTLPIAPVYVAVLILRKKTISKLKSEMAISEHFRRQQTRLLQALVLQACLPVFTLGAVVCYATEQLNIYHHPILEFLPFLLFGVVPMLTPLISIYFIRPYREWVVTNLFCRSNN